MSDIEVSIIMISYNKYPQNLLTLYSFENQTFDLSKLEVIFIDDNSTDETLQLRDRYQPPFRFTYIRCETNVGRSRAKNIGIDKASGKILIFLDAEMLVEPDFIEKHHRLHQGNEKMVVSTTNAQKSAFTIFDSHFNQQQLSEFFRVIGRYPPELFNPTKVVGQLIKCKENPRELLSKDDMGQQLYKYLSYPSPTFKPIIDQFGPNLHGFYMPWIFCITRNVSIPRKLIDQAGYFSEAFNGWGCEDNEYGYRLYKLGAGFYDAPDIVTYHQEHPYSEEDRRKEAFQNIITFQQLHPEIDVAVLILPFVNQGSYMVASRFIDDYKRLSDSIPDKYQTFKQFILYALHEIPKLCIANNCYTILPFQQSIRHQLKNGEREVLQKEANEIRSLGRYHQIIYFYEIITSFV